MSRINAIENAIKELGPGEFQKLFDAYLYKKYRFKNIQTLGMQDGTNKTTKGVPDSYVIDDDRYILIMYGSVKEASNAYKKLREDVLSCFNKGALNIDRSKIKEIICAYRATNIHIEQLEELKEMTPEVQIEFIGLSTISYDLEYHFPNLAKEYLNISVDTNQIFTIDEFVKKSDQNGTSAPLAIDLYYRRQEMDELYKMINSSKITMVTGASGIGKTRLVLEVCKRFETEGWTVWCVKNNGLIINDDLHFYIAGGGNYILFIDDANHMNMTNLRSILEYITYLGEDYIVKVVMTVRDYAKSRIQNDVCQYDQLNEIAIKRLKNEEIKEILKNNLGIFNENYLDQIAKISDGNIRIAILAGEIAIDKGLSAINSVIDIFAQYYGEIIRTEKLTESEVNTLFVISILGTIRYKESKIAQTIAGLMNITYEQFLSLCNILNDKELIDLYQDTAAKVSDQNLGNYILYYVLIDKKTISVFQLLQIGFPEYKKKLVYTFNTILELFYSKETEKYIGEQINKSWVQADSSKQEDYLKCFFSFNMEKSLEMIKQKVDNAECVKMDVTASYIEKKKNYVNIKDDEIEILGKFKYSRYYEDAIELLLQYYEKRPDLVMDFYFSFTNDWSFDSHSHSLDYDREFQVVNYLWEYSNNGSNTNITILMLNIFKQLLKCSFQKTEPGDSNRTIRLLYLHIMYTDGSKKLRLTIWDILSRLYTNDNYTNLINSIIIDNHVSSLDLDDAEQFFIYDLKCIKEMFFDTWGTLTFGQCQMLKSLEQQAKRLEIEASKLPAGLFARYAENEDFIIYNKMVMEGLPSEENEIQWERQIEEMVRNFTIEDYKHLFKICKNCENDNDRGEYSLKTGLELIFSLLEDRPGCYRLVAEEYINAQTPYGSNPDKIISVLLRDFGVQETKSIIINHDFQQKHNWLSAFWGNVPADMLNGDLTKEFLNFVKQESLEKNPNYPSILCLDKFRLFDEDIIKKISEIIIMSYPANNTSIAKFLDFARDDSIDVITNLYTNEWQLLEKLYLLAIDGFFDHKGKLLMEIIYHAPAVWEEFTNNFHEYTSKITYNSLYEHNVFNNIWMMENYKDLIHIAFKNMIGDIFDVECEKAAKAIFANDKNTLNIIIQRKQQWIKDYIKQNYEDVNNIKMIFEIIVSFFASDRKEFVLELLENTKNINLFKSISLFPTSESWSGSAVPLIDEKIIFLDDLMESIKGTGFIEHKSYLRRLRDSFIEYKDDILVKEYMEDNDTA